MFQVVSILSWNFPWFESVFLNRSHIYSCKHCLSNVPDETIVKVTFMNGKLEKSVVLPKGLYLNYLYLSVHVTFMTKLLDTLVA